MPTLKMSDVNNHIKPGTTLITAQPFTFLLSAENRKERCDYCFKICKLSRCSGCQYVYYCSRNCQKLSWTIHKIECPNIKRVHPRIVPDAARMMARIIIKLHNGGATERGFYTPTEYRTFNDMMSHISNIKNDMEKMKHFTSLSIVLFEFLPKNVMPHPKELLEIFGRLTINSFHILDTDMTSLGVGLYLGPSIIDHSCKPNASATFEGTTIIIKSLHNLPALDWSKIFVTYIDILRNAETRQDELRKSYYFNCECARCSTPEIMEIAAVCQNKNCAIPCLPTNAYCNKCGEKFPNDFKERFDIVCELSNCKLMEMAQSVSLDVCKMLLKKQEGLLHPFNLLTVRMLEIALAATIDIDHWEEAEIYASQLIPPYIYYHGEVHPVTGRMYFTWGRILSLLNKKKKALEVVAKAVEIIKLTFGENHSKMTYEVKPLLSQLITNHM
ncbi:hypothetical protein PV328_000018 [Microctonus aethiopoides]|uniref:MYND-type domain-containing protein n=1 Tax=Microctonus aethiopoides TaxID=144406 RepID=A0AA39FUK5_9HYME|nr:hypothetical protein PV328_000018 [Microctonus aethiopoides]